MISSAEVLTCAMQLCEQERADLAHSLLLSLEPEVLGEEEISSAWHQEIEHRLQKIADGNFQAHEWRPAIMEIREGLKKEPTP